MSNRATYLIGDIVEEVRRRFAIDRHAGHGLVDAEHFDDVQTHRRAFVIGHERIDRECVLRDERVATTTRDSHELSYPAGQCELEIVVGFRFHRV